MDEIEIVIENIPTRFIKTVKYGNLNYDEVKNTIRIILWDNDDDDEHSIREFNKTIIDWLEDNDTVLKFTGSGQAHCFAGRRKGGTGSRRPRRHRANRPRCSRRVASRSRRGHL